MRCARFQADRDAYVLTSCITVQFLVNNCAEQAIEFNHDFERLLGSFYGSLDRWILDRLGLADLVQIVELQHYFRLLAGDSQRYYVKYALDRQAPTFADCSMRCLDDYRNVMCASSKHQGLFQTWLRSYACATQSNFALPSFCTRKVPRYLSL